MTRFKPTLVGLTTVLCAVGIAQGLMITTDHLRTLDFPPHAKFHAALSGLYMVSHSVFLLLLVWGPLMRGGRGAIHSLTFALLALPAFPLVAMAIVPSGIPPSPYPTMAATAFASAVWGSFLAWKDGGSQG
ncbi:MAG: hypothetical protein AB1714_24845 [Acidobacteriota bacterium]